MLLAGLTVEVRHWQRLLGWNCEQLRHLTLIDPVCQESCSSTCSKLLNYHFKEVARKGYPFEQNASIHTSKLEAWHWALWRHGYNQSLEESAVLKFYFPKLVDIRCPLYPNKGNRIVNEVSLILKNRWQGLASAYVQLCSTQHSMTK